MKVTKNSKKSPSSSSAPKSEPVKPATATPAPAEKPRLATAAAVEKPAAKTIKPAVEKAGATPTSAAPKTVKKSLPASAPARKTVVEAKVDVGFGNRLFIRGQGDGLSWEKGTLMECRDNSTWVWSTTEATDKVECKVLLNDQVWAQGDNLSVAPGESRQTVPVF